MGGKERFSLIMNNEDSREYPYVAARLFPPKKTGGNTCGLYRTGLEKGFIPDDCRTADKMV